MTRKEDLPALGNEQTEKEWSPKLAIQPQKPALIDTWLSQFEERIAQDFRRRTGLDYKTTVAQIIEAAAPHVSKGNQLAWRSTAPYSTDTQ